MIKISPAEYAYLDSPMLSAGSDMLKFTLQALCYKQFILVEKRMVLLNPHDPKKVMRVFLRLNPENKKTTTSLAEQFMLEAFSSGTELVFYHIRNYIKENFGTEPDRFKNRYVSKDLSKKGLCFLRFFPNAEGREQKEMVDQKIKYINANIESLIINGHDLLVKELAALGANILLLDKKTIKQLRNIEKNILDADELTFFTQNSYSTNPSFDSFGSFDTFDTFSSLDFSDHSVDFGGGDFGGAGSHGHW